MRLRNASKDDAQAICSFMEESAESSFPGRSVNMEPFRRRLLANIVKDPEMVKVAESGGEAIGYIWLGISPFLQGGSGRIRHIFIEKSHRGKGLGRQLMLAAEELFRARGIRHVSLVCTMSNKAAISLYSEMGFKTARFVMEKDL